MSMNGEVYFVQTYDESEERANATCAICLVCMLYRATRAVSMMVAA